MKNNDDFCAFINYATPIAHNPINSSLYVTTNLQGGHVPPGNADFIITQTGLNITTLSGLKFITDT
jgi:hypothetical protein